jgi:hypothetical protein
LIDFLSC